MEKYEIPNIYGIFHTITKWLHTGYTLTSLREESLFDVFILYNSCVDAIEEYNKEIKDSSKGFNKPKSKFDYDFEDSTMMTELYNDLRDE